MPYNVSKFAKQQMQQSGWVEGKGLGRKEDGMSEAIKVKIKADSAGVGHDPGEEFTFHWWEHAFTKSAQNIKVTESEHGVEVVTKSETEIASARKQNKKLLKKQLLYGTFVKSGVLEHGAIKKSPKTEENCSDSSDSENETAKKSKLLTDEELLAACGGRTAHKGARHGLKSSGKLARLQEQEMVDSDSSIKKGKKKRKRKKESKEERPSVLVDNHEVSTCIVVDDNAYHKKSSKKLKRKKRKAQDHGSEKVDDRNVSVADDVKKNLKKSKRRKIVNSNEMTETEISILKVKKKKKKRKVSLTEIERNE